MENNKDVTARIRRFQVADISFPAAFHHAEGVWFTDIEGHRYLDFSSGYGVANLGWQHPGLVKAMQEQSTKTTYAPPWMPTEEAGLLSEKLAAWLPGKNAKCLRAAGGGDANEILIKALFAKNKGTVVSFERSYHGGTHATLGMGDSKRFHLPPVSESYETKKIPAPYCLRCPWNKKPESCSYECVSALADTLENDSSIKTFFAEPVIGSGGIIVPPSGYFTLVKEVCSEKGVALIFDEVLTGCGRTGRNLYSEKIGVEVDGFSLAKGMASGFAAIGVGVIDDAWLDEYKNYDDVSSTFAWTPLSCRMALETLTLMEDENIPENAEIQGEYLMQNMRAIMQKYMPRYIGEIRGTGLMMGVEMVEDQHSLRPNPKLAMRILLTMLKRGVMWCASWDYHTMIAMPPLIISRGECDEALNVMETSVKEIAQKLS